MTFPAIEFFTRTIHQGNCLDLMKQLPDRSVDAVICDLPYGVTKNHWDSVIPLDELWSEYKRITKPNSPIIQFGQGLFSAKLMLSNEAWYRYTLIWEKDRPSGFLNAKRMPLRNHEDILVFYQKQPVYHPQMTEGKPSHSVGTAVNQIAKSNRNYGTYKQVNREGTLKYPKSVLKFPRPHPPIFPTEKPVELLRWLLRTYTEKKHIILDNCIGSGSTLVACELEERFNWIGMELLPDHIALAQERLQRLT